jgi:hypothetical protein
MRSITSVENPCRRAPRRSKNSPGITRMRAGQPGRRPWPPCRSPAHDPELHAGQKPPPGRVHAHVNGAGDQTGPDRRLDRPLLLRLELKDHLHASAFRVSLARDPGPRVAAGLTRTQLARLIGAAAPVTCPPEAARVQPRTRQACRHRTAPRAHAATAIHTAAVERDRPPPGRPLPSGPLRFVRLGHPRR